jgi:hypothetical protein
MRIGHPGTRRKSQKKTNTIPETKSLQHPLLPGRGTSLCLHLSVF